MSSFTLQHARRLADNAFRYRPDKFRSPDQQKRCGEANRLLVGKEKELLEALRAGERRYLACNTEIKTIRKLRKSDVELPQKCAAMANSLQEVADALSGFDNIGREEMNLIAVSQGSSFEEMSERLNDLLYWVAEGADENFFPPVQKTAGAKLGVGKGGLLRVPFEEFAKELRSFLLRPDVGVKFSFESIPRDDLDPTIYEPVSAAARLFYDAMRILDNGVKLGDVQAVIRAVKRKPEFRTDLLGDSAVDAHTH
jgi:hypothetical protein